MMKSGKTIAILCAAFSIAACKATTTQPSSEDASVAGGRPAVIVNPSEESRAELRRVVGDMLFGAEVTLSEGALTESSVLTVERQSIRSLGHPPVSGRDLGRPERFRLMTTGTQCFLIHDSNQARYELTETECVPEE